MNTVSHKLSELRTNCAVNPTRSDRGKGDKVAPQQIHHLQHHQQIHHLQHHRNKYTEDRNKYTICNTTNITITSQLSRNCTRAIVLVKSVQRSKNFVEKRSLNLMTARALTTLKPLSNQPEVVARVLTNFL